MTKFNSMSDDEIAEQIEIKEAEAEQFYKRFEPQPRGRATQERANLPRNPRSERR
jgi:hypothetical protein